MRRIDEILPDDPHCGRNGLIIKLTAALHDLFNLFHHCRSALDLGRRRP
jgi:hypothetical protein